MDQGKGNDAISDLPDAAAAGMDVDGAVAGAVVGAAGAAGLEADCWEAVGGDEGLQDGGGSFGPGFKGWCGGLEVLDFSAPGGRSWPRRMEPATRRPRGMEWSMSRAMLI